MIGKLIIYWRDLKISTKITIGMVLCISIAIIGIFGVIYFGLLLSRETENIVAKNKAFQAASEIHNLVLKEENMLAALIMRNEDRKQEQVNLKNDIDKKVSTLEEVQEIDNNIRFIVGQLKKDSGKLIESISTIENLFDNKSPRLNEEYDKHLKLSTQLKEELQWFLIIFGSQIDISFNKASELKNTMIWWGAVGSIAGFSLALILGLIIAKKITAPLKSLVDATKQVAEGNLTVKINNPSKDELGKLSESISYMVNNISNIIQLVMSASKSIYVSSHELTATSEEIEKTTEQVALAIGQVAEGAAEQSKTAVDVHGMMEQTTRSMQDIAEDAKENSTIVAEASDVVFQTVSALDNVNESAIAVSKAAENSSEAAKKGQSVVGKTVEGMERINISTTNSAEKIQLLGQRSQRIGEIIEVIDDIAEQTNLLALNAAIEAARAGEHGKGFAVVADEVRKLAEKSANATKEISTLIENIQSGVEEAALSMNVGTEEVKKGAQLAEEAGTALKQILIATEKVVDQIQQVTSVAGKMKSDTVKIREVVDKVAQTAQNNRNSSEKVASDTQQVLKAIDDITAIAQETAASTEEVSASAEQQTASIQEVTIAAQRLTDMAYSLSDMVSRFKVDGETSVEPEEIISLEKNLSGKGEIINKV